MSNEHGQLNRCIHLARRNACFERGLELLCAPTGDMKAEARLTHVTTAVQLLGKAHAHALLAARTKEIRSRENDFIHFLDLVLDAARSIQFMMKHQAHLEREESFLCRFLETGPDQCLLPALHYQRRADDLMQGLWEMFRLAAKPYRKLVDEITDELSNTEKKRYEHAYNLIRPELIRDFPAPNSTAE